MIKAILITNFCPHYRVRTFETLAQKMDVSFVFVSEGGERYWDPRHGIQRGNFNHEYLSGFNLPARIRITPGLISRVWNANVDVIFIALAGKFALPVTYLIARLRGKPIVLWTGLWMHPATLLHRLTFPVMRYFYTRADAIAVYGSHVRDYLISIGVEPERIFIAHHAVDNDLYNRPVSSSDMVALRRKHNLIGRRVILYVGRLDPLKGLSHLIQAVAALGELRPVLMLVGAGDLRDSLAAQASAMGVETCFLGYVPTTDLYRYYSLADVFVLPSLTTRNGKETWGLVVNEAMNQGVPVIASTAVGAAAGGLVRDGETGLVVPEKSVADLSVALRRVLTDSELALRLRNAGRREIAQWTNDRMTEGFVSAANYALGTVAGSRDRLPLAVEKRDRRRSKGKGE